MAIRCFNTAVDRRTIPIVKTKQMYVEHFWYENPVYFEILRGSYSLEEARERTFNYLGDYEKRSLQPRDHQHPLDHSLALQAIRVLKTVFSKRSEALANYSAFEVFFQQAHNEAPASKIGFWEEFRHLFFAMKGKTGLFPASFAARSEAGELDSRQEASRRSRNLDELARHTHKQISRYTPGLDEELSRQRELNQLRIQILLGASDKEWQSWEWQCRNVIRDGETLAGLIGLTTEERTAIDSAKKLGIPFGITPYYVSLMDPSPAAKWDKAVRMQVIPPLSYVDGVAEARNNPTHTMDFMGEKWTSPVDLVTRRYPNIAIFKPFNTCAQICVYCQRNWEINDVLDQHALASKAAREQALQWFSEHPEVNEILVTGGDPGVLSDHKLKECLDLVASVKHITRVRIGTRTPVVLPMRITDNFADLLAQYHRPGIREVALMTHFQHPTEITPAACEAVQRLRTRGISVYNQAVFTAQNCHRFEMVALRRALRLIGVDPYYTFNAKGKEESIAYRVPIARLLQEQAEEARLTPGLDRTDEAVFNIPRLGKNYLRNANDHQVIMIMENGSRLYEFFPWDRRSPESTPYLHLDASIYSFLNNLRKEGHRPEDYRSIWYYY